MNEDTPALTQAPPAAGGVPPVEPSPPASPAVQRGRRWAGPLAVVAVAAVAVVAWQVFELRSGAGEVREEFAQRLAVVDASVAEVRTLSRQQHESIAALQGKLGALESQVAATEGQAAALEALYQEFSRTREDRLMAETEQAIGMAAQQLQLAGNLEAALIALQGAEARLAAQERGQLLLLRRALQRDIERLKALPQVDVPGIALRLETLLERADTLPLGFAGELPARPDAEADAAAPSGESAALDFLGALARDLWRELRTLVRIERLDRTDPVLLAPAQSTYLRENLKIRLLTARLALLARDGRTFGADVAQARGWIERFFDLRDERVQQALTELRALEGMPVRVDAPELTESLTALRQLQARSREQPAVQSPAPGGAGEAPAGGAGEAPAGGAGEAPAGGAGEAPAGGAGEAPAGAPAGGANAPQPADGQR
jgi:uroporphyrin-3 C-methyltransferase